MYKRLFAWLSPILICILLPLSTQATTQHIVTTSSPTKRPYVMQIAPYVLKTYDLNFNDNTFKIVFWLYIHHQAPINPIDSLEIVNAIEVKKQFYTRHTYPNNEYTDLAKFTATIKYPLSLEHYPFDTQKLKLQFEDADLTSKQLVFKPYYPKLKDHQVIDRNMAPENWHADITTQHVEEYHYFTNFGDLRQPNNTTFSRYTFGIDLERDGYRQFLVNIVFLYLAAMLAIFTQFIDSEETTTQPRNSLLLASIFCLTSAHVSIAAFIRNTSKFILIDKLQLLTLLVVLISFIIDRLCSQIMDKNKRYYGLLLSLFYIVGNLLLIGYTHSI